jgi:hypothetical protein
VVEKLGHLLGPTISTPWGAAALAHKCHCSGGLSAPGDLWITRRPFQGGRGGFKLIINTFEVSFSAADRRDCETFERGNAVVNRTFFGRSVQWLGSPRSCSFLGKSWDL